MITIDKWNEFVNRWQEKECYGAEKYLHWKSQIDKFSELAESAGLYSGWISYVLDISTGMGIWPYVLKEAGICVSMTDIISKKTEIYRNAHAVLGLPPVHEHNYAKNKFKPLPAEIGSFDVISAIACAPMSSWFVDDWLSFFLDCEKHLKADGCILLSLNISESMLIVESLLGVKLISAGKLKYYKIQKEELK